MATLFTCDFENGLIYDTVKGFDIITVNGGGLEANAASKHNGNYGCEVTPVAGYKAVGIRRTGNLTRIRQSFYLHPNGITIPTTRYILIARNQYDDAQNAVYTVSLKNNAGVYVINAHIYSVIDYQSSDYTLPSQAGWNKIEFDFYSASSGFFRLWIDDSLQWDRSSSCDTSLLRVNLPCVGAVYPLYTISGSYYLDDWTANSDGADL